MASVPKPPSSDRHRNIRARADQQGARHSHHPLAGSASGTRRELAGRGCDVGPNDRKVAGFEFEAWPGARLHTVPQGHFGYRMMRAAWAELTGSGVLQSIQ